MHVFLSYSFDPFPLFPLSLPSLFPFHCKRGKPKMLFLLGVVFICLLQITGLFSHMVCFVSARLNKTTFDQYQTAATSRTYESFP